MRADSIWQENHPFFFCSSTKAILTLVQVCAGPGKPVGFRPRSKVNGRVENCKNCRAHEEPEGRKCRAYRMKYFNRYRQCQGVSLRKHIMCHIVYLYQSLNLLPLSSKGSTSPTRAVKMVALEFRTSSNRQTLIGNEWQELDSARC